MTTGWWMAEVKTVLILITHKYIEHSCARKITSKFLALSTEKNNFLESLVNLLRTCKLRRRA
jgi:hypothetical protein